MIRIAEHRDLDSLLALDHIAQSSEERRQLLDESISRNECYVAVIDNKPVAYLIFNDRFFRQPFIELLYVDAEYRRQGFAAKLISHIESLCSGEKLFTSTNISNTKIQFLLEKLSFDVTGEIYNLDEGDPEIVYMKRLK